MKKAIVLLSTLVFAFVLSGCGKKSLDGFYVFDREDPSYDYTYQYFLEIDGDTVYYHCNENGSDTWHLKGYSEKTEDGVDIYIDFFSKYTPLHAKLSDDGSRLYLSSDNQKWKTDTYTKVSKDEYTDKFVALFNEHFTITDDIHFVR